MREAQKKQVGNAFDLGDRKIKKNLKKSNV